MTENQVSIILRVRPVVALVVILAVSSAWYLTWVTSDFAMSFVPVPTPHLNPLMMAPFLLLMIVMMVAMMLPSSLPMILTFYGLAKRGEERRGTTLVFVSAYFVTWGIFGVLTFVGVGLLSSIWPAIGIAILLSPTLLFLAGVYQFTRAKEFCLSGCQSPLTFVLTRWRPGLTGALGMGLNHAAYCLGCCWLFMLVLFFVGSMSLLWMGIFSLVIFLEKVGFHGLLWSRLAGSLLIFLGLVLGLQALVPGI